MTTHPMVSRHHQRGVATLVMAVLTLVLVSMVTLYGSRSVLLEQRIMSNDARARHALQAAEAGIAAAIEYFRQGMDRDADGVLDAAVFDTDNDGIGDTASAAVGQGRVIVTPSDLTGDRSTIRITAQGFSDDASATRIVSRVLSKLDPLPRAPQNPLTTRGGAVFVGTTSVTNPEGHSTIWSGNSVDLGDEDTTHTAVADGTDPNYPDCLQTSMTCGTATSSNRLTDGLDIIESDLNLANLSKSRFFLNFFGTSPAAYRASMATLITTNAEADAAVQLATNAVIWVDGNTTFTDNTTIGCAVEMTAASVCSAGNLQPSILIVDGNVTLNGTAQLYGLVYITGSIEVNGTAKVHGALLVAGSLMDHSSGDLDITYDSSVLRAARRNGPLGLAAGSWQDF